MFEYTPNCGFECRSRLWVTATTTDEFLQNREDFFSALAAKILEFVELHFLLQDIISHKLFQSYRITTLNLIIVLHQKIVQIRRWWCSSSCCLNLFSFLSHHLYFFLINLHANRIFWQNGFLSIIKLQTFVFWYLFYPSWNNFSVDLR